MEIIEIEREIVRAYLTAFGRDPDPQGNKEFLDVILKGTYDIRNLLQSLRRSSEYRNYYKKIVKGGIGKDVATLDKNGIIVWNVGNIEERISKYLIDSGFNVESVKERYRKEEEERLERERLEVERLEAIRLANDNKARANIGMMRQLRESENDKIIFVSTWDQKCGIALYTKDLLDSLERLEGNRGLFIVRGIDYINSRKEGFKECFGSPKLIHFQHEFGILPRPPDCMVGSNCPVIITWHTILPFADMNKVIKMFESKLNVVCHIVPCEGALEYMRGGDSSSDGSARDVRVVQLGSRLMPGGVSKEDARKMLDMDINFDRIFKVYGKSGIGFVFGFQSPNKVYSDMIEATKRAGMHLIISGSTHQCGYDTGIKSDEHVTMIDRYLSDAEIDLIALASDVLIFDYISQEHYSSSSALHRIVGAGRPVVCCNTRHFDDIREELDGALKFNGKAELEGCIKRALERRDELGMKALEFARRTSREEMAKRHMEIYRRYVNI